MGFFKKKPQKQSCQILQTGWQFYHRPTTLEPIGTVFRIDPNRRRFIVDKLDVESRRGKEVSEYLEDQIELGAGILARLVGVGPEADTNAKIAEKIIFSLIEPEREVTTDRALDDVLQPFLQSLNYRIDNRYFLIRECRWAKAMIYRLSKERIIALGGEATVNEALKVKGKLNAVREGFFEINCTFEEAMQVMFLPEEVQPISAGLGSGVPELGLVPVNEPLVWEE